MSSLRKPSLGPIVGHTTHQSCRLWISAENPDTADEKQSEARRTLGLIGIVKDNGKIDVNSISYFRLHREYSRTGTFNLGDELGLKRRIRGLTVKALEPETSYRVRLATLSLDDAFDNDSDVSDDTLIERLPEPASWEDVFNRMPQAYVEANFKTFAEPPDDGKPDTSMSFLLGSCRYPGLLWKRKKSDRIFGPMLQNHQGEVAFALMMGDQIYADVLGRNIPILLADTYAEFQERYTTAFGSRNMREFLRHIPTYMTLDDHEIEDNWTQDRMKNKEKRVLFNLAIDAYMSYQWSHGPRSWNNCAPPPEKKRLSATEEALHHPQTALLYYDFLCEGYPFFVLDTRTQRCQDEQEGLDDNHLLGRPAQHISEPGQLERFLYWLKTQQDTRGNTPKFIVSASVFAPNPVRSTRGGYKNKEASDSWPGFPNTRRAILDFIVENKIENIVFLSGDVHCGNVCEMTFKGGPANHLKLYNITSSAFYWPFPFADGNPSDSVHDSTNSANEDTFELSKGNGVMDYKAWGFTQADNYCRINIDPDNYQLDVYLFDQKGNAIKTGKKNGVFSSAPQRLKLTPW
ncbi:MAG: alkaline phosphatase family protein [Nitrospirae bacterium]|nr:alkaline phosphatase family protein [Candidatus Manganitrophaceae bacterium]